MKRNTMLAFTALFLVMVIGAGAAYWAVKKYRAKQRQEFRVEGIIGEAKAGFQKEALRQVILTETAMDTVIEEHQLVAAWGVADVKAAKERINTKFKITLAGDHGTSVKISYQDKNKDLAEKILQSLVNQYRKKVRGTQGSSGPAAGLPSS